MKQILLEKGAVTSHDVPIPTCGAHDVLVVVYYSFIDSGSHRSAGQGSLDATFLEKVKRAFHIVGGHGQESRGAGLQNHQNEALRVLGVSCAGQVMAVGSHVRHVAVGDWVACSSAEYALHAEIVSVPEHLVAVVQSKKYIRAASIAAIGARGLHALRRAQTGFGETVAVIGLGLLGQLTVQLARMQGCRVIAIDVIKDRRDLALKLGADRAYDAHDAHIVRHVLRMTNHAGVDATIIAANSEHDGIVNQAAMITRKCGRVVAAGHIPMACDRDLLADKEIDLIAASSFGPGRYNPEYEKQGTDYPYAYVRWTAQRNLQAFIDAVEREALHVDDLITHEYELDEVETAYQQVMRKTTVGIVLKYRYEEVHDIDRRATVSLLPAARHEQEALRVGVLGLGYDAEQRLLPALSGLHNLRISTLVDTDNTYVYQAGRNYRAEHVSTDPSQVLASKYVEAIAIDNPDYMQDAYIFDQVERGIGVFLTRLPFLHARDVRKWRMYAQQYASAPICVNLHRSFSSHIQTISHTFFHRNSPLVAYYRIAVDNNAAWYRNDSDWSRVLINYIGHALDVFMTMVNRPVKSFSVLPLHAPKYQLSRCSNAVIHFTFEDGSVCSLMLTSLGAANGEHEYLEVFSDGASITLNNNIELHTYGLQEDYTRNYFDDGYARLVSLFFEPYGLPEFTAPIPFNRIVQVIEIATNVQNQLYAASYHAGSYAPAYMSTQP